MTQTSMESRILEAAKTLFFQNGFAATSTTDIARLAGCNQALVHYISDTVYIMEHGKFVEYGKADEVILNPQAAYTKRLISDVPKIHEEWDLSTVELKTE